MLEDRMMGKLFPQGILRGPTPSIHIAGEESPSILQNAWKSNKRKTTRGRLSNFGSGFSELR